VKLAERIAESFRRMRREAGVTQSEMARRLGLSQSTIARAEKGTQNLTARTLDELCAALDCNITELLEPGTVKLEMAKRRRGGRRGHS
jgi:transcriptional regulator with XRE-family HTH domain